MRGSPGFSGELGNFRKIYSVTITSVFLRACANSVYQVLPRAPGNESRCGLDMRLTPSMSTFRVAETDNLHL